MKKLRDYFVVCAVALFCIAGLNACNGDDDDEPVDSSSIIGTWQAVYDEIWEKENGKIVYQESESYDKDDVWIIDLKSNGRYATYDEPNTYPNDPDGEGNWKLDGKKLSLGDDEYDAVSGDPEWDQYTVESVDANSLVLSIYEKDTEDGITYEVYSKTTYKKIK